MTGKTPTTARLEALAARIDAATDQRIIFLTDDADEARFIAGTLRHAVAAAEAKPVAAKALEWVRPADDSLYAQSPVGRYSILTIPTIAGANWWHEAGNTYTCTSIPAAQAAAQADFERRILSALVTSPAASDAYAAGEAAMRERAAAHVEEWAAEIEARTNPAYMADEIAVKRYWDDAKLLRSVRDNIRSLKPEGAPPVERVQPGDGWLPIETAPKDGTRILVWFVHRNAQYSGDPIAEGWAAAHEAYWIDHNGGGWTWYGLAGRATLWQPLPAPPAGKGG